MMNNESFRQEMHDFIDERYDEFQVYQKTVVDSLKAFDSVCRKNDITYYLGFGSLLGIYRDNEILPWDYDIDVLVPITEKNRLIKALKTDLNSDFYFYCPESDKKCRHYCLRLIRNEYDSAAIHMDVFYLIGSPSNKHVQKIFRKLVSKVNFIRKYKLVDGRKESMGVNSSYIISILRKIQYSLVPIFILNFVEELLCKIIKYSSSKYVTTMQAAADTYTHDVFKNPSEILFDDYMFYAPTDVIKFLNQTYKDYKLYPDIQCRFEEFYNSSKKIRYFNDGTSEISKMNYQINKY